MLRICFHNLGRRTYNNRIWLCYRLIYHCISSDITTISYSNITIYHSTWANVYIIANPWSFAASFD